MIDSTVATARPSTISTTRGKKKLAALNKMNWGKKMHNIKLGVHGGKLAKKDANGKFYSDIYFILQRKCFGCKSKPLCIVVRTESDSRIPSKSVISNKFFTDFNIFLA